MTTHTGGEDTAWAERVAEALRTQDNRCTAEPFFLVQEQVRHYGYDPEYSDTTVFVDCDGEECEKDDATATETAYVDRWEYVTGCLTEQGAKDYIAANSHRHKWPLRIYADSLYRNREMIEVRKHLLSLSPHAPKPPPTPESGFRDLINHVIGELEPLARQIIHPKDNVFEKMIRTLRAARDYPTVSAPPTPAGETPKVCVMGTTPEPDPFEHYKKGIKMADAAVDRLTDQLAAAKADRDRLDGELGLADGEARTLRQELACLRQQLRAALAKSSPGKEEAQ